MDKLTYLTNKLHYDEEDKTIYKIMRVVKVNGFIVSSREDSNPIYAKDVVEYTTAYDCMQQK